jgi:tetratricopeptide (TPR) repeat protein
MGTLYRARDPHLGRDIALKVLHERLADSTLQAECSARLLREAQVLARLSHANVVAAYDVGTYDGALFIAMEFIEGMTLRDWLASRVRDSSDVIRVLIAAGRGLVAAHDAGVLHRDFKPANVMVSPDGRVRVIDFGLARTSLAAVGRSDLDEAKLPSLEALPASARSRDTASVALTGSGHVVGTPGYISPEQWLRKPVDHRSDQFSFAVTAFVALTGQKPYLDVVAAARAAELRDTPRIWPRSTPRGLRRVIDRGLALNPEHRHPSLATMVRALERAIRPRRKGVAARTIAGVLFAGVALPGAIPLGATPRAPSGAAPCAVDATLFRGVWDSTVRGRVERAFHATARGNASEAFELIARRMDAFEQDWLAMRRTSCEATLLKGEQTERVMALRANCLDRALAGTKALVAVLAEVTAPDIDRIAQASPASLTACADTSALLGVADQLPTDPAVQAAIHEVAVGLAVNEALIDASRGPEAIEQARKILEGARTTGHLPTIAAATAQLGRATHRTASTSEQRSAGEVLLNEGIRLAAEAGDARLVARTSSYVFNSIAYFQKRMQEAEAMFPAVEALVQRAGNSPEDRMQLLLGRSTLLFQYTRLDEARQALEEVIRLSESTQGKFEKYGISAATDLAHLYVELDRFTEAEAIAQRATDDVRRLYGAHHPRMMSAFGNLSTIQAKAGHRDRALYSIAEYRRIAETMPPDEPRLKYLPLQESRVWRITGDCARAVPLLRDALAKFSAADGPDHPLTTQVMSDLGVCLGATKQVPEALSFLERALANRRQSHDVLAADSQFALAQVLWSVRPQRPRALSLAEEALSQWRKDGSTRKADESERWIASHRL